MITVFGTNVPTENIYPHLPIQDTILTSMMQERTGWYALCGTKGGLCTSM